MARHETAEMHENDVNSQSCPFRYSFSNCCFSPGYALCRPSDSSRQPEIASFKPFPKYVFPGEFQLPLPKTKCWEFGFFFSVP